MVEATNGVSTVTITKGAFEGIYKHQGYTLVKDYSSLIQDKAGEKERVNDNNYTIDPQIPYNDNQELTDGSDESSEKSFEMNELLEVPIGQWSREQLKEFATANNISLEGVTTTKEVRNIIKDYINSQK